MRVIRLVTVFAVVSFLLSVSAQAQPIRQAPTWLRYYLPIRPQLMPSGGGSFAGGAVTGATSFLDGANFQIKNTADPTKIIQFDASGITTGNVVTPFNIGGTAASPTIVFSAGSWAINSSGGLVGWNAATLGFGSGSTVTAGTSPDAFFVRAGAASMQMGASANGAVVDQILKGPNGVTGTDIAGGTLTLAGGIGTGAGVSRPLTLNRQITKATGTTVQTYAPAVIVCPSKILSNTSATAQTIATITTTTTSAGAISWFYSVTASNGTAVDVDAGTINVGWNNNAGTVAATAGTAVSTANSVGAGTLVALPTATVATNVVSLKVTPTWGTIVPTTVVGYATFQLATAADTIVCQ